MYGYRARIGYTSPPLVTEVFPYEFYRMAPAGVTLAISTLGILTMNEDELKAFLGAVRAVFLSEEFIEK